MVSRTRALLDDGRAEEALAEAKRVLDATPGDADAVALCAEALLTLERWEEALAETERLLRAEPESVWGRRMQCVALENLRRFESAIETAREAIRLAPNEANAHFLLAKNLWQTSRDAEAVAALERAIALEPDVPNYRFRLAHFLFESDPKRAEALLERIVADEPNRAGALNDLGVLLQLRGDTVGAGALYLRALRADPKFDIANRNRIRIAGLAKVPLPALGLATFGAVLCGAPAALGIVLSRKGSHGAASLAFASALVGLLVTLVGGLAAVRGRRALARTAPERSER